MPRHPIAAWALLVGLVLASGCRPTPSSTTAAPTPTPFETVEARDQASPTSLGEARVTVIATQPVPPRQSLDFPILLRSPHRTPSPSDSEPQAPPDLQAEPDPRCSGIAIRDGSSLSIDGQPIRFFGINAPFLTEPDFPEREVEPLLAELALRVDTLRIWFFHDHDPARLERLLDLGARHGIRFVVTLGDNVHKGVDWFNSPEEDEVFKPHLEATVARFKDRPEILLWEPMNEPNCGEGRFDEACVDTIRDWLQSAVRRVKAIDGCRVVSTGMIGAGNYDLDQGSYRKLHKKDALEILSVHKRSGEDPELELELAEEIDKPLFYGEIYDQAYDESCSPLSGDRSPRSRAGRIERDLRRAWENGVDGYLLWDLSIGSVRNLEGDRRYYCSVYSYEMDDPVWERLLRSGLLMQRP